MIDAAIACLHRKHPVQIPLDFGKQVRQVAFGRDIPLERIEVIGEMLVKRKERVGGNARIHGIATIVARIVPTLRRIDGSRCTRRTMQLDRRIRMARRTFPLARIGFVKSHGGTLVVVPLEGSLRHLFESLVGNLQVRTKNLTADLDGIGSGNLQVREIHQLHILTARAPIGGRRRSRRKNRLAIRIRNFHGAVSVDQGKFLGFARTITDLVDVGRRGMRHSRKGKHRDRKGDILFQTKFEHLKHSFLTFLYKYIPKKTEKTCFSVKKWTQVYPLYRTRYLIRSSVRRRASASASSTWSSVR